MALADIELPSREIKVGKGSFTLYGLSLAAVAKLVNNHLNELESVFDLFTSVASDGVEGLNEDTVRALIAQVVSELPNLTANVILLAANETDEKAVEVAVMLPAPIQIDALLTVYALTFEDVGGLKKLWEVVAPILTKGTTIKAMTEKPLS